jgi:hypothetical protein
MGSIAWFAAGGTYSSSIAGGIAGISVFTLIVWKFGTLFEEGFQIVQTALSEPIASCLLFGLVGSFLLGGVLLAAILLLGHTRPMGWDFTRIPLLIVFGFLLFGLLGLINGKSGKSE